MKQQRYHTYYSKELNSTSERTELVQSSIKAFSNLKEWLKNIGKVLECFLKQSILLFILSVLFPT